MKSMKYINIPLALILGLSLATYNVHAEDTYSDYFVVDITYPGKDVQRYYSYNYVNDSLDLSSMKASKKKVKIKLVKVIKDNETEDLDDIQISYDYITSDNHVNSLEAKGKTISLPLNLVKASAYSKSSVHSRLAIRDKDASPLERVDTDAILPIKETKYHKNINTTINLNHLKNGLYGAKTKGIQLSKDDTLVNNNSLSNHSYSWWTSEYKYINKQWCAATFILSINYPFSQNEEENFTAYKFNILRTTKGYLTGIKLMNFFIYAGTSTYGEVWKKTSLSNRDDETASLTSNWKLKDTFKYRYLLKKPVIKKVKASRQSITMTWKKRTDCDGFEIQYGTKKSFKGASKYTINSYTATKATLNSLDAKTKYYIRMRSFGTVDGRTYYSSYSKAKNITTKK